MKEISVEECDYCRVRIIKGKWKNHLGYYDDDEGQYVIVYLEKQPGKYVLIKPSSMVKVLGGVPHHILEGYSGRLF